MTQLTESLEDYLEAIAELISVEGHAHAKEIAEKLNVKMPSVTGALRQLVKLNYIVYNVHYPVELTPAGKALAEDVIHRHTVLRKFFSEILGLTYAKASETACHLEHIVDGDTIRRFVLFSEAIEKRSDARALQTYLTEAMSNSGMENLRILSECKPGETVVVKGFCRNLTDTGHLGVSIGDTVTLQGFSLDRTSVTLMKNGTNMTMPLAIAENIWMSPEEKQ